MSPAVVDGRVWYLLECGQMSRLRGRGLKEEDPGDRTSQWYIRFPSVVFMLNYASSHVGIPSPSTRPKHQEPNCAYAVTKRESLTDRFLYVFEAQFEKQQGKNPTILKTS